MTSGGLPTALARRYAVFLKHTERAPLKEYCELRSDSDYLKGLFLHPKKRDQLRTKRYRFQKVCMRVVESCLVHLKILTIDD
jgi:hypothetical protein